MAQNLDEFLAAAVEAAKKAGEIILKGFHETKQIVHKGEMAGSNAAHSQLLVTMVNPSNQFNLQLQKDTDLFVDVEPEFETSQRAHPTRIKSSTELEEEMMAKMPKFKARPVNKKILEAPSLQAPPRSTPQLPEFKEFHLETMSRANQNSETASVVSTEHTAQGRQWKPHYLTAPETPVLHTSLRARPPTVKSFEELQKEEIEKLPKFKALPLNKKIFESKGGLGISCNLKRQITVPEEFHFALDERIPPPPTNVADLFYKLSLNSELHHSKDIPRVTNPNPFNLYTEVSKASHCILTNVLMKSNTSIALATRIFHCKEVKH